MRRAIVVATGVLVALATLAPPAVVSVATVACNSLPDGVCFADRVNGLVLDGGVTSRACTSCLQQKCCDQVGVCQDDPACANTFREAHRCVTEAGAGSESECTSPLLSSATPSRQLYDCMRSNCGGPVAPEAPCGISNCDVDEAVVLLANARCDRCLSGSCCQELNECYKDRRCKLTVECIVHECRAELGADMNVLTAAGLDTIRAVRSAVCQGSDLVLDGDVVEDVADAAVTGACIERCLVEYAPFVNGTADDANARCRAFEVFACGAANRCGDPCTEPDAGTP